MLFMKGSMLIDFWIGKVWLFYMLGSKIFGFLENEIFFFWKWYM